MKKLMIFKGGVLALAISALVSIGSIAKAEYPEKPVDMTVLFGGTAKSIALLFSELMSKELGQPVVPVSRTGGGVATGYSYLVTTAPDGYNIVWNSNSINTPSKIRNLTFYTRKGCSIHYLFLKY